MAFVEKKTEKLVFKEGRDAALKEYKSKRGFGTNLIRTVFYF
ncbi:MULTISPECIES: hypothetical protein [Bacteria]|jgi:hypothetical protein|nr:MULTISPECIES: hypothetical protein [Pseudoalteromonas]